jgi:hypothetical protein
LLAAFVMAVRLSNIAQKARSMGGYVDIVSIFDGKLKFNNLICRTSLACGREKSIKNQNARPFMAQAF